MVWMRIWRVLSFSYKPSFLSLFWLLIHSELHIITFFHFLMSFNNSISYEEEATPVKFNAVAILPKPGDNVAVAINEIPMGSLVELLDGNIVSISHTVLEGHRFAVKRIEENDGLYSWGMQFGTALKTIQPGEYIMNERGRKALSIFPFVF